MTLKDKMREIRGVLFDLDGTLVDSMWMWDDIDIAFLARFGLPVPENLHEQIEGMSFTETAVYFREQFSLPMSIEEIKEEWNGMARNQYLYEVPLKPGVLPFLEHLKSRGIPTGIATSNSRELVEAVVNERKIGHLFDCVITACEVNAGKPAPDIYLRGASLIGVTPKECMVFEDIPAGIRAGKSAGMAVTAIEDSFSAGLREEKRRLADYYIEDFTELLDGQAGR